MKDEEQVQETREHPSKEETLEKIQNQNVRKDEPNPLKKDLPGRTQRTEEVRRSLAVLSEGSHSNVKQLERENAATLTRGELCGGKIQRLRENGEIPSQEQQDNEAMIQHPGEEMNGLWNHREKSEQPQEQVSKW